MTWDPRYRRLEQGELILATDEVQNDDGSWRLTTASRQRAPDPSYTSHRVYRRLVEAGQLTDADRAVLDDLRSRGFAVVVWTPEELGSADQGLVEDRLIELGHHVIYQLGGHEDGDEEAE